MSIKTQSISSVLRKDGITPSKISVVLVADQEAKAMHCVGCGKFLLRHQHRVLAVIADDMGQVLNTSPLEIQCQKCGFIFNINII